MSSSTTLVSGLGGAVGSDRRRARRQLVFVEFGGRLSRLDLFRSSSTVSSGTAILHGTWLFDFDLGAEVALGTSEDVWWRPWWRRA